MKYVGRCISHRPQSRASEGVAIKDFLLRLKGVCTCALESSLGFLSLAIYIFFYNTPTSTFMWLKFDKSLIFLNGHDSLCQHLYIHQTLQSCYCGLYLKNKCYDQSIIWFFFTKTKKDYGGCCWRNNDVCNHRGGAYSQAHLNTDAHTIQVNFIIELLPNVNFVSNFLN